MGDLFEKSSTIYIHDLVHPSFRRINSSSHVIYRNGRRRRGDSSCHTGAGGGSQLLPLRRRCVAKRLEELIRSAFYQDAFGGCIGKWFVVSDTTFENSQRSQFMFTGITFPGVRLWIHKGQSRSSWLNEMGYICF